MLEMGLSPLFCTIRTSTDTLLTIPIRQRPGLRKTTRATMTVLRSWVQTHSLTRSTTTFDTKKTSASASVPSMVGISFSYDSQRPSQEKERLPTQ